MTEYRCKPVFLSGEWFTLLLNLPLIAYHVHRSLTSSPPPSPSWSSPPPPPPPPSSYFAGIWNGLSCLAPASMTRPISWTPTLFPGLLHCVSIRNESVVSFYFDSPLFPDARRRAGESWPFIWSPSSIISMGKSCHCIIIIKSMTRSYLGYKTTIRKYKSWHKCLTSARMISSLIAAS